MVPVFVALTVLAFVAVDAWLARRRGASVPAPGPEPERPALPPGLFLHPGHVWAQIRPSGRVRLGLDAFLARAAGASKVRLPEAGRRIERGEPLCRIESGGRSLAVPSPLTGTVESLNSGPEGETQLSTEWVCSFRPERLGFEIASFTVAERAAEWLGREWRRFAAWLSDRGALGAVPSLPDGGAPYPGALRNLEERDWTDFQRQFLALHGSFEEEEGRS